MRWTAWPGRPAAGSATSSRTVPSTTRSSGTRRRRPRWSAPWVTTTLTCRWSGCLARCSSGWPRPPGCGPSPRRSPTAATCRTARWCRGPRPGRCCTIPARSRHGCWAWSATQQVTAVDGSQVSVRPDSVCVHGDTPGAVAIARAVRDCAARQRRAVAGFRRVTVMNAVRYGDCGVLVWLPDQPSVLALLAELTAHPVDGQVELVPADGSLLVRCADAGAALDALADVSARRLPPPAPNPTARVDVDVVYDGPDLDEVARLAGCSVDEVAARHGGQDWTVAFTGFAPGFGYLVGDRGGLQVPRRATPRTERRGRIGRSRWQLLGDLPGTVTGRMAAHRPSRRRALGSPARPAGLAEARHARPVSSGRCVAGAAAGRLERTVPFRRARWSGAASRPPGGADPGPGRGADAAWVRPAFRRAARRTWAPTGPRTPQSVTPPAPPCWSSCWAQPP